MFELLEHPHGLTRSFWAATLGLSSCQLDSIGVLQGGEPKEKANNHAVLQHGRNKRKHLQDRRWLLMLALTRANIRTNHFIRLHVVQMISLKKEQF